MKLAVVILTLDEVDGARAMMPRIPRDAVDEVVAVDGGSTDGTLEVYAEHGVRVLEQTSRGRGEAFRVAFEELDADAIVFFSPDGNEDPADIARFRPLLEEGADLVIASRMMPGAVNEEDAELFRLRKWANNAFNVIASAIWCDDEPVTDSINGFRAVRRDAWELLRPDGAGYTIEYQSTIRAYKAGLTLREFPTHEGERIGGESKAHSIPTGLRFLRLLGHELAVGTSFLPPGYRRPRPRRPLRRLVRWTLGLGAVLASVYLVARAL